MISLPKTIRELSENRKVALCLYHTDDILLPGITVEIRNVDDGELLSAPFRVIDSVILANKRDELDEACSKILERCRLFKDRV